MLTKNDVIELTITDINAESFGIGRYEGMAVFVPDAAIGDRMRVRIVKVLSGYCYSIVEELLEASPDRIEIDCPVFEKCGGCSLRHISYQRECEIKNNWVQQNLRRLGGVDIELPPLIPSPEQYGYRNKAVYPVQKDGEELRIGFFQKRSHRVVHCTDCLIQPKLFTEVLGAVEGFLKQYNIPIYDEETHKGLIRHIFLRYGEVTDKLMLCLVINGTSVPHSGQFVTMIRQMFPQVSSIVLNINRGKTNVVMGQDNVLLYGEENITDVLCGVEVGISPLTFYQVNRAGAEKLYAVAREFARLKDTDVLLDLYCGAGTIGLSMAKDVKEVIGVEVVAPAVENARANARRNEIENVRFLCADAEEATATLLEEGVQPDVVVVDPPRKGCEPGVIELIGAKLQPERFVYISCNSATMARDVKLLSAHGYRVEKAQAVDMFPRTGHVECVCLMCKD